MKCVIVRSPLDKRHNTNKNNRNCTPSSSFMTKRRMTLFVDINIYIMYTFLWQIFSILEQTDLMVDSWIDLLHVSSTKASSETRDKTCVEIGYQNLIFHWNLRLFEGHYLCFTHLIKVYLLVYYLCLLLFTDVTMMVLLWLVNLTCSGHSCPKDLLSEVFSCLRNLTHGSNQSTLMSAIDAELMKQNCRYM